MFANVVVDAVTAAGGAVVVAAAYNFVHIAEIKCVLCWYIRTALIRCEQVIPLFSGAILVCINTILTRLEIVACKLIHSCCERSCVILSSYPRREL